MLGFDGVSIVSRLGGAPRHVGKGAYSCWLPGGSQVVTSAAPSDFGIWLVNRLTGQSNRLPAPKYGWLDGLTCSAKTGVLLLLTVTSDRGQIWSMKPDGSEQRKLVEAESGVELWSPRWSASGDAIYYFREEKDTTELMKLSLDQSARPSVLVGGLQAGIYFSLSADGSELAYIRKQDYSNFWSVELPARRNGSQASAKPLTSGTLIYASPAISPDGRWLVFVMISGSRGNVYKMPVEGGQPVQLTFLDSTGTFVDSRGAWSPKWSPDGKRIAFITDQGGTAKIWIVDSDGGNARPLDKTDASSTNYTLSWYPSHDVVYAKPGLHNLLQLDAETQQEKQILPQDSPRWFVRQAVFSPDGKKIAIQCENGVWLITLENLSTRFLYPNAIPVGWSPDSSSIYAYRYSGGSTGEILQIRLENLKQPRTIVTLPGIIRSGSVSPDGRRIIVSVGEVNSDVWLMKDFDPETARSQ